MKIIKKKLEANYDLQRFCIYQKLFKKSLFVDILAIY